MNLSTMKAAARSMTRSFCCLILAGAVLSTGAAPVRADEAAWLAKAAPIRVMAIGDSITAGVGKDGVDTGSGGYRSELVKLLDEAGYHYSMTGGETGYSSAMAAQRAHEGHPGYVLRSFPSDPTPQLYGPVTERAIRQFDPDVILLMAGTNDLLRYMNRRAGYTLPNIAESLNMELAEIFYLAPNVDVIVAGVVSSPRVSACAVETFDGTGSCAGAQETASVRSIAAAYAARGFHIAVASGMGAAVPRDVAHFPDGIHPAGPGGYLAMAHVWMAAIESETAGFDNRGTVAGTPAVESH